MGEDPRASSQAVTSPGPEQLEREIEQTREELGDTVEALALKADVKGQAERKLRDTKAKVSDKADDLLGKAKSATPDDASAAAAAATSKARETPIPIAAVGAFVAGFVIGRLTRRVGS
jgi:ElaB/YqjD/DUF883 family membrane-anchored ribosome-binding protein